MKVKRGIELAEPLQPFHEIEPLPALEVTLPTPQQNQSTIFFSGQYMTSSSMAFSHQYYHASMMSPLNPVTGHGYDCQCSWCLSRRAEP